MNDLPALLCQVELISDYAVDPTIGDESLHDLRNLYVALNNAAARIEYKVFRIALAGGRDRDDPRKPPGMKPRRIPPPGQI